jgi:SAM-dependent methyltransferase
VSSALVGVPDFTLWRDLLTAADRDLADDLSNSPDVFRRVPLDVFGALLLDPPPAYPRLRALLPTMPSAAVQEQYTGASGSVLLGHTVAFVRTMLKLVEPDRLGARGFSGLDFGVGWGRILRVMLKYAPPTAIDGTDPWERSLEIARSTGLRNQLVQTDELAGSLPRPHYDLIWAFSVFTHLSREAFEHNLDALLRHLAPGGTLVITIRPAELWLHESIDDRAAFDATLRDGFCFRPHPDQALYGDAAISLDELDRMTDAELVDVEWCGVDALQVYVALRAR